MFRTCSLVDLSTCPSGLTGPEVNRRVKGIMVDNSTGGQVRNTLNAIMPNKYGTPIIPFTLLFTSGPVNPERQVDRLTGRQANKFGIPIMPYTPIFTSGPINPCRKIDGLKGC